MREMRVVYEIPGMDRVRVRKDLTYKAVHGVDLNLDVYLPPKGGEGAVFPAVVFVHGGMPDWSALEPVNQRIKDWAVYVSFGQLVAASGFAGITFNHSWPERFTNMAAVAEDINDLLAYVRDNAGSLNIDKNRICVWSISMGVPFGVRAATKDSPDFVRCIVAYYGPLDLRPFREQAPGVPENDLSQYSPILHVHDGWPPTFIARAGLDQIAGINNSIDAFIPGALRKNLEIEVMNHAKGQHAFDIFNNDDRSREIIQRTLEFMKAHLKA